MIAGASSTNSGHVRRRRVRKERSSECFGLRDENRVNVQSPFSNGFSLIWFIAKIEILEYRQHQGGVEEIRQRSGLDGWGIQRLQQEQPYLL